MELKYFKQTFYFYGEQSIKVSKLVDNENSKIFSTYIELFITAALVGCINGREVSPCKNSNDKKSIFSDQFQSHSKEVELIYRIVMLLGKKEDFSEQKRFDNAFKNYNNKECYDLFERYVCGGIDILYEAFYENGRPRNIDNLTSLNDFINSYKEIDFQQNDLSNDDFF
jgi:hypothetical protein